jgi:hypothetical protein
MVTLLAGIITFITWLMLSYAQTAPLTRLIACVVVFLAVGFSLTQYVLTCLRRHCPHRHQGVGQGVECPTGTRAESNYRG